MNRFILLFLLMKIGGISLAQEYDKTIKGYIIAEFHPSKETILSQQEKGEVQQRHMQHIKSLAENDNLVLAGPFFQGGGLFILNTTNEEEAKAWIEKDPTIESGINTYTLRKWFSEKGLFTLDNQPDDFEKKYGIPNLNAPKETMQYGQLVGKWEVDVSNLTKEGDWIEDKAEWTFCYILDGYAIQDFWIKPANGDKEDSKDYMGTNVRIFNSVSGKWKCTWVQNDSNDLDGVWTSYQNEAGELILHDDSQKWQITFFNITKDSFDWKWDFSQDDGSSQTRVKIKAKRID